MESENKNYTQIIVWVIVVIIVIGLIIWGFLVKSPKEVLAPSENNIATSSVNVATSTSKPLPPLQTNFDIKG